LSLDAAARRRYARQLLVGEIGEAGQERLLAARYRQGADADEDAYAVAAEYLERAGCFRDETGAQVRIAQSCAVSRFAGVPALREPAAVVMGAFAAVEHLKEVLGISAAQEFPAALALSSDD